MVEITLRIAYGQTLPKAIYFKILQSRSCIYAKSNTFENYNNC